MGSKWDQTSTALLLACVDWCVASDNELDLKTEVPRLMAAQDAERSWKSITAKLASLNRLFAGPDKRDVKVHGSGALALGQAMNLEIAAARQSIEAAETADEVDRQSAATATERGGETGAKSAPRKRSREDDGQENSESSPRKLRKTAAARHEEMDRLAEPERNEASEPEKSVGEPSTDEIPQAIGTAAGASAGGEKKSFLSWLQREKQEMKEQRRQDREFHQMVLDTLQTKFDQREAWYEKMIARLDDALGKDQVLAEGVAPTDTQIGTPSCYTTPPPPAPHRATHTSTPAQAAGTGADRFGELSDVDIEYSPPGKTLSEAMNEDNPSNNAQLYTEPASRRQSYDIDENYTDDDDDKFGTPVGYATNSPVEPNPADRARDTIMSDESDTNTDTSSNDEATSDDDSISARNRRAAEMSDFNINNVLDDPQLARDVLGESQIADISEGAEYLNEHLARHGVVTTSSIAADAARSPSPDNETDVGEENELPSTANQASAPQTPEPRTPVPGGFGNNTSQLEPPSSAWSSAANSGLLIHNGPYTPAIRIIPPTPDEGSINAGSEPEPTDGAEGDGNDERDSRDSTFQSTFDRNFPGYHFDDEEL